MMRAFNKLYFYKMIIKSAVHVGEKSKQEQLDSLLNSNMKGFLNIHNECDYCKKDLLPSQSLNSFVNRVQQQQQIQHGVQGSLANENRLVEIFMHSDKQRGLLKAFLVFRCGHKFHKKCVVSKKQIEKEETFTKKLKSSKEKMSSLSSASRLRAGLVQ